MNIEESATGYIIMMVVLLIVLIHQELTNKENK